jgi:hypothetical protein
MKLNKIILFTGVVLLAMQFNSFGQYKMVDGWMRAGSKPKSYDIGKDDSITYYQNSTYYLKSIEYVADGFGTILKNLKPADYLGKRIRMTGFIKSENLKGYAGMWMRVDGEKPGTMLSFDNMFDRKITGSNDWMKFEIVLDVPDSSINIGYGVLIWGEGEIWFPDLTFEIVGNDVPTTDIIKK